MAVFFQLDGRLQVVPLRARHPHCVALDRRGDLELGILDELLHLLRLFLRHADLDGDRPLHLVAGDLFERPGVERAHIDIALRQPCAQDVGYLAELELVIGVDRQHELVLLDASV